MLWAQYGAIDGQSVLMVCINENRLSDFFSVDKSVLLSLMSDYHLIFILFPPVILTSDSGWHPVSPVTF